METPTDRNLAFARQAASHATFRVLAVFLFFGVTDLVRAVGQVILARVLPPEGSASFPLEPNLSSPIQMAFVALAVGVGALELGALVVTFRARARVVQSVPLLAAIGAIGLVCRGAAFAVSLFHTTYLARVSIEALAVWNMAASMANAVSMALHSTMILGVFVAAAIVAMRDRVPPEKPLTYREAPHV